MELQAASSDTWEKILFLFLGWLLGLLSPIVVDAIRRRRALRRMTDTCGAMPVGYCALHWLQMVLQ